MVCKPNCSVEVQKGDYKLTFNCAIARNDDVEEEMMQGQEGEQYRKFGFQLGLMFMPQWFLFLAEDMFNIEEFAIHKGEWKDSTYVMSGEVMDGVSLWAFDIKNPS